MKSRKRLMIGIVILLWMVCLGVVKAADENPSYQRVEMGRLEKTERTLIYGHHLYPLYAWEGQDYISLSDLIQMGANKQRTDQAYLLQFVPYEDQQCLQHFENGPVWMSQKVFYLEGIRSYALEGQEPESYFLPIKILERLGTLTRFEHTYTFKYKKICRLANLKWKGKEVINVSKHPVRCQCCHLFFIGGNFYTQRYQILLEQGQSYKLEYPNFQQGIYITTDVAEEDFIQMCDQNLSFYGQKNEKIFAKYLSSLRKKELEKLFPRYCVMGQLVEDYAGFKKGERLEIWRAEKKLYYWVKTSEDKSVPIPCGLLKIQNEKSVLCTAVTSNDLEEFISYHHLKSTTPYCIWADLYRQRVHVFQKENHVWKHQKSFICSSGKPMYTTPQGIFKIEYSMPYFGTQRNFRCKYALVFFRDYMFHSILFDESGQYIKSGQYDLGRRVSHGCIRLSQKDSKWLYSHIPVGTTVWVR